MVYPDIGTVWRERVAIALAAAPAQVGDVYQFGVFTGGFILMSLLSLPVLAAAS